MRLAAGLTSLHRTLHEQFTSSEGKVSEVIFPRTGHSKLVSFLHSWGKGDKITKSATVREKPVPMSYGHSLLS